MAVIENRATESGDVLIIKTDVPVIGIVALTSFVDDTEGETVSIYFEKKFRYSINGGITFTDWIELTTINIQNIVIERIDYFVIEYRYKRVGDGIDTIAFNSINLNGTLNPLEYPVFNSMIFSSFFTPNTIEVLDWALNVLEKLYKKGIIPSYIIRDTLSKDDEDFISYWFSITHFFAILVYYARSFENISTNTLLMREFVKGRGVYMRNSPDIEELYYIYTNYIEEIRKRGTKEIYRRGEVDGELLRLLNADSIDECLFAFTSRGELGWCIGQSSPLYTGADNIMNLIKGYEFGEDVIDLDLYPLLEESYISLSDSKIQITNVPDDINSGIGILVFDPDKVFIIDPSINYEISFKVKKSELDADLSFGVGLFDKNGVVVSAVRITDGVDDNRFFTQQSLNLVDTEYWVRGVLHSYDSDLVAGDILNIGFGQGLRSCSSCVYMSPLIIVENTSGSTIIDIVQIYDIKVRPADLGFSRGFLSSRNFIIGILRNRNTDYNDEQIEKIINEQLIPYNTFTLLKFI